jgi:hypothetical protein
MGGVHRETDLEAEVRGRLADKAEWRADVNLKYEVKGVIGSGVQHLVECEPSYSTA